MRLFGKVDGSITRFDRAEWLTPPFDLAFASGAPVVVYPPARRSFTVFHTTVTDKLVCGINEVEITETKEEIGC